ncbi:MAG: alpha/beta hydrolase-fold protein [Flavobacteriales bacterium]
MLCILCASFASAQSTDTLRFHSAAFGTEREVVVHLPEFHRYTSDAVHMPVLILLDGQHEWVVEPLLTDIRYLQFAHIVPQAIVVTVPHVDRVAECAPDSITQPTMPLLELLTKELPPLLKRYHPGDLTVLVGHSFTASFALYAHLAAPEAFDAVIALSPLHLVQHSMPRVADRLEKHLNERVLVAVGGESKLLDGWHRGDLTKAVEAARIERTQGRLLFREYPSAGHTSLPIIAFADLLSTLFTPYATRDSLIPVGLYDYKVLSPPPPPELLLKQLEATHGFLGSTLPWGLDEVNGLLSRLDNSDHNEQVILLLRKAIALYPNFYYFHAWLGDELMERDPVAAKQHVRDALRVLNEHDRNDPDYVEMKAELEGMLE